jgi:hypothetical protein
MWLKAEVHEKMAIISTGFDRVTTKLVEDGTLQ